MFNPASCSQNMLSRLFPLIGIFCILMLPASSLFAVNPFVFDAAKKTVEGSAENASINEVLKNLGEIANFEVSAKASMSGEVTISAEGEDINSFLRRLLRGYNFTLIHETTADGSHREQDRLIVISKSDMSSHDSVVVRHGMPPPSDPVIDNPPLPVYTPPAYMPEPAISSPAITEEEQTTTKKAEPDPASAPAPDTTAEATEMVFGTAQGVELPAKLQRVMGGNNSKFPHLNKQLTNSINSTNGGKR